MQRVLSLRLEVKTLKLEDTTEEGLWKFCYREKILGNLDKLLHSAFETSAASQAVFDIDDLTSCNQRGKERGEFCSRPLSFESRQVF